MDAFIWLPKETAIKLSGLLNLKPDSASVREIVAKIRELALGKDEAINSNFIIIFP
ncbi:hypothetical protein [Mucilaginibacter sp.]|uniref:hypothetical protein n=1 Tax=Mucilaginibacter sp. TaxID=1882438 RepID=UPI003AFFC703